MPRPPSSSSSAATAANGPASIVDLPSNSDPSRKHHLHHSSSSAAASASATGAESKSSRHVTDLSPSMSSSPSRSSGVNRASGSSSMSMPPHPGLLSPGVRIGMSSAANGTSARTSARDNDLLASVDELKEYKDEGDADAENKSSAENLDEEKRGLLTGLLTEAEQGKLFRDASFAKAIYSSIGSSLPATFDGDVAAAFRDYYGIHRPVPFSPFFSPYHHQYAHHHAAAAASSYLNPYGTGPTQHPGAPASPASATGFGAGMTSLLPSATQRLYGSNPYSSGSSNPYDHLQHPSSAAAAAAAAAVAQHPASSFHFNTASASGLSQSSYRFPFSSPFLTPPEFPQGACFDPLLRSAPGGVCSASNSGYAAHSRHHPHHQYAAISPFCLPPPCCLTPAGAAAAAALGATFPVGAALAAARDYFPGPPTPLHSPVAPTAGISSTYPGVSHPALVANTSNVGDIEERFMPSALQPPPPCCPPSPSGDGSRALHAWYPRHCPPAAGNGASSSLNQPLLTTNGSGSARESSSAASVISSSSPGAVGTDVDFRSASDSSSGLRHRPDHARRQSGLAGFRPGGSAFRSSISGSSLLRNEHRFFGGLAGARRSSKSSSMSSVGLGQFGPHQHGLGLNGGSNASGSQHHVKKPLNAFMLFMKEMRSKVIDECTLKESAAINQILGRKWHSLDRTEQARYYEMARREKLMHRQLFPGWTARENYAAIARKVKRKLSASAGHHSTHFLHNGPHGGSSVGSRPLPHTLSTTNSVDRADNPNAKKCRARYGLEHQNRWCKPCRRKKRCIRFLDNPSDDVTGNSSTAPIVAADSTSDFCASETGNASNKNKQPQLNHSSSLSASPPKTSSASSSFLSDQHHQPLLQTLHRSNDPAGDFLPPRLDGTSGINAGSGSWLSPMTSGGSSLLSPLPSRYHVSPSSSSAAAASVAAAVVR